MVLITDDDLLERTQSFNVTAVLGANAANTFIIAAANTLTVDIVDNDGPGECAISDRKCNMLFHASWLQHCMQRLVYLPLLVYGTTLVIGEASVAAHVC